jgi:hypothetical protein
VRLAGVFRALITQQEAHMSKINDLIFRMRQRRSGECIAKYLGRRRLRLPARQHTCSRSACMLRA